MIKKVTSKVASRVKEAGVRALEEARKFLETKIKETLNVSAPKVKTKGGWRIVTPATVGMPPRKVTGRLRNQTRVVIVGGGLRVVSSAKSLRGFPYPLYHETKSKWRSGGRHPFVRSTVLRYKAELQAILKRAIRFRGW